MTSGPSGQIVHFYHKLTTDDSCKLFFSGYDKGYDTYQRLKLNGPVVVYTYVKVIYKTIKC